MNALSITWKLRADMLGILVACTPEHERRDSERRLVTFRTQRRRSDIRDLRPDSRQSPVGLDGNDQLAVGEDQSRPRF